MGVSREMVDLLVCRADGVCARWGGGMKWILGGDQPDDDEFSSLPYAEDICCNLEDFRCSVGLKHHSSDVRRCRRRGRKHWC